MLRKPFFASVLCAIVFCGTTERCFADAAAQLQQAQNYQDDGYTGQAEQLYRSIAESNPGTDSGFKAYKGLISLYIRAEQTSAAAQIISQLTGNYSAHPDLPKALRDFARHSARRRAYEQAKNIYEQLRQQFAGSMYADGAALGIAKVDIMFQIESSRYAQAEAAVGALITDFAGNSALPEALFDIAGRYGTKRKYKEANNIYQLIVQQYPSSDFADKSPLEIARTEIMSLIRAGFDARASAAIDKLCSDFATNPELPRVLYGIAGRYRGWAKYNKAIRVFQKVIQRCPDSSYVDKARLNIARCNVLGLLKAGKYAESAAAFDKMIADFPDRLGLRGALKEIASRYEQAQRSALVVTVNNKIITDYPASVYALEAKKRLIYTQIRAGQLSEAQQAIGTLKQDFAGHADLPNALNDIARILNNSGYHAQAENVFQQLTQQYSEGFDAEEAQINLVRSQVLLQLDAGQTDAAFAAAERLVSDFRGNYWLPWALCRIAEQYYDKASNLRDNNSSAAQDYFQKAIALYEKAAENAGNAKAAANAHCGLGRCYRKMGDYEKAQQAYAKVVNDYGESDLAWYALYLSAQVYEDMGRSGLLSEELSLVQAGAAYQQLLQQYPDCKLAARVQDWLNRHSSN